MDEATLSSQKVLRKEFKRRLQPNLHSYDHFLLNFIDEEKSLLSRNTSRDA